MTETKKPAQRLTRKFEVGQCCATPGVLAALEENGQYPIQFIARHQAGDWGDLSDGDKELNEQALIPDPTTGECDRILSAYRLKDNTKIYIITEWDRSKTTVLLPSEY